MGIDYMKSGDSLAEADGDNTDAASDSEMKQQLLAESASAVDELLEINSGNKYQRSKKAEILASYTKDSAQALTDAIHSRGYTETWQYGNGRRTCRKQSMLLQMQNGTGRADRFQPLPMGVIILIVAVVVKLHLLLSLL